MSIKKLGAVLVAALALAATGASSASAAVETKAVEWYTGATAASVTTLAGATGVTANLSKPATLTGVLNGQAYELSIEGLECAFCEIRNEQVTAKLGNVAIGIGALRLRNVKATKPFGCTVTGLNTLGESEGSEIVTTRPLTFHADWMDTTVANQHGFVNFFPTVGTVLAGLQFKGEACPIAGKFNITGTLYGETTNNTAVMAKEQPLQFSQAVQETTGASLKLGPTNVTTLTGTGVFSAMAGFFGVK